MLPPEDRLEIAILIAEPLIEDNPNHIIDDQIYDVFDNFNA